MFSLYLFYCACAMEILLTPVTSSVVLPGIALQQMDSDSACLFMCMMCFSAEEHEADMMTCSNTVCTPGQCNAPGLVWLGRACKNPTLLDMYLPVDSPPPSVRNTHPPFSQQTIDSVD